ncbi:MAG TPA: hypothetical protein VHH72_05705 [Solirubrobacterales bacterium]|jgi:hypothetical protein|nr:hypothetical protein [Solirubrobacterales bacterium]
MQLFDPTTALATEPSAGGAAIGQVVLATALIGGVYGALALLVLRHRSGNGKLLGRIATAVGDLMGLPQWAALPLALALVSLIVALFGMYWDISLHIDQGRDAGPLANIAHYPILLGLMGIFASGWRCSCRGRETARARPRSGSAATGTRRSAAS